MMRTPRLDQAGDLTELHAAVPAHSAVFGLKTQQPENPRNTRRSLVEAAVGPVIDETSKILQYVGCGPR